MEVIITVKQQPLPQANQLLVMLPFAGIQTNRNRLATGFYYSAPNTSNQFTGPYIWTSIFTVIGATIAAMILAAIKLFAQENYYPIFLTVEGQFSYPLNGTIAGQPAIPTGFTIDCISMGGQILRSIAPNNDWQLNTLHTMTFLNMKTIEGGLEVKIFLRPS